MAYFTTRRVGNIQFASSGQPAQVILQGYQLPQDNTVFTAYIKIKNGPETIVVDSNSDLGLGEYGYLLSPGEEISFTVTHSLTLYAARPVWNTNQAFCFVTITYDGPA